MEPWGVAEAGKLGIVIFSFLWLYLELKKWFKFRKMGYGTNDAFKPTASENRQILRAEREAQNAIHDLGQVDMEIQSILSQGKNVRRNKKGDFDARSPKGKVLNRRMRAAITKKSRLEGKILKANDEAERLKLSGWIKAVPWIEVEAKRLSIRMTIMGFAISIITLSMILGKSNGFWWGIFLIGIWYVLFRTISKFMDENILPMRLEL